METIIKTVSEKAGISQAQATTAVQTIVNFLKDKMPAGMGSQVEAFLQGQGAGASGKTADEFKEKIGSIFGK